MGHCRRILHFLCGHERSFSSVSGGNVLAVSGPFFQVSRIRKFHIPEQTIAALVETQTSVREFIVANAVLIGRTGLCRTKASSSPLAALAPPLRAAAISRLETCSKWHVTQLDAHPVGTSPAVHPDPSR